MNFLSHIFQKPMKPYTAVRGIIHVPYHSKTKNKTYNSVLLVKEKSNGKFSLPGGKIEKWETAQEALKRELYEELGIDKKYIHVAKNPAYIYQGRVVRHEIFQVFVSGWSVDLEKAPTKEIQTIGFFNAGSHNRISDDTMEKHVQMLVPNYYQTQKDTTAQLSDALSIPGKYYKQFKKEI